MIGWFLLGLGLVRVFSLGSYGFVSLRRFMAGVGVSVFPVFILSLSATD